MLIGKNKRKMGKKALCLIFAFLLSIESFGAVVSDNDGSAFITKAEFDSLKNDFQSQIDQYNTSIDNKIDAAIATYLSGIKVEISEELTSLLNKINGLADDFYIDAGGNKVKYGYRCMARRYAPLTTQKPIGAITNLIICRVNAQLHLTSQPTLSETIARVSMNYNRRTAMGDVHVPRDNYQIGKYMMIKKRNDGTYYPYNQYDDVTYRYFVGGQSFTYDWPPSFPDLTSTGVDYNDNGVWTHDDFTNRNKYWGLQIGTAKWVWEQANWQEYSYDPMRTIYGGSFEYQTTDEVFPLVSYTDYDLYMLDFDRLSEMAVDTVEYNRNLRLDRGLEIWKTGAMDPILYSRWHAPDDTDTHDDHSNDAELDEDPNGGTVPWTFHFNHHPYIQMNTKDLVDNYISETVGRSVKLTSGLPVCTATMDGVLDIKMEFMGDSSHGFACGWQKKEFEPNNSTACQIDGSLHLRNFNDVARGNTVNVGDEIDFRMDVKKGDTIWIRCVDTSDQYGFVGAKTTSIKITKKD